MKPTSNTPNFFQQPSLFFGIFLFAFGVVFTILGYTFNQEYQAVQRWPAVQGTIVDTSIDRRSDEGNSYSYSPVVVYHYSTNGSTYSGDRLMIGIQRSYDKREQAAEVLNAYPRGAAVTVYYNPANPADAVLDRETNHNMIALIAGIAMLTIGLILLIVAWWLRG